MYKLKLLYLLLTCSLTIGVNVNNANDEGCSLNTRVSTIEKKLVRNSLVEIVDTTMLNGKLDCLIEIFAGNGKIELDSCSYHYLLKHKNTVAEFDSLGYIIRKITTPTGIPVHESYQNKVLQIKYEKKFERGNLKCCGFSANALEIGCWKYYSEHGELDSIVDYEQNRASFCDFYELAKSFGMVGKHSRLPTREEFFKISDLNNLTIQVPDQTLNTIGWPSVSWLDIRSMEEQENFTSSISYNKINGNDYWIVHKIVRDGKKRHGYGILINLSDRTIQKNELIIKN